MFHINNLCKNYLVDKESIEILKGITVNIDQGEFVSIVGPSGCGKTTFLNMLSGIDKLTSGEIEYNGERLSKFTDTQWARWRKQHIGYVFQSFNLIEYMTAQENVELALRVNGFQEKERKRKAQELLKLVGLGDRTHHLPSQLSGGQKQRVAIARALANNPDVILADEPTGAIDSVASKEIMEILRDINQQRNVTIVMVTHDQKLADMTDRKISLFDGQITEDTQISIWKASDRRGKCSEDIDDKSIVGDGIGKTGRMSVVSAISLAMKNISTKKKRTILTSMGTAIGIMGVLLIFGIGAGAKSRILNEVNSVVNRQVITVTEEESTFADDQWIELCNDSRVENVYYSNTFEAVCKYNDVITSALVESIGPVDDDSDYNDSLIKYGNLPQSDEADEIVIPENMAQSMVGEGNDMETLIGSELQVVLTLKRSDDITYQVEQKMKICGISGTNFLGTNIMRIGYKKALEVARESMKDANFVPSTRCITLKEANEVSSMKQMLTDAGYVAEGDEDALKQVDTVLNMVTFVIMLIAGISLIVSGIMISLVTYMGVVERTREIGIMKAIGFSARDVLHVFTTEGAFIGLLAGILGVLVASLLGAGINGIVNLVFQELHLSLYKVNVIQILFCIGFSILLAVVCSHSPAKRASKLDPVKSLGYVD